MSDTAICSQCGERHSIENIEYTLKRPDVLAAMTEAERKERCKESQDLCALWGASDADHRYFVRGVLPLPVHGREHPYNLGVWAEIPKASFDIILERWDDEDQSEEPAFSGRLANEIPFHKSTLGAALSVFLTGPTTRPRFEITDTTHTLHSQQCRGISEHEAYEYTRLVV